MGIRWTMKDIEQKGLKISNSGNKIPESVNLFPKKTDSFALGRMKAGKMNKTETAYFNYLQTLQYAGDVLWFEFEPMNLKLADKCFYRIDFLVMVKSRQLECHEVKGYWTDDALVKIKTAAEKFPFRFIAVKLVKGEWEVREF